MLHCLPQYFASHLAPLIEEPGAGAYRAAIIFFHCGRVRVVGAYSLFCCATFCQLHHIFWLRAKELPSLGYHSPWCQYFADLLPHGGAAGDSVSSTHTHTYPHCITGSVTSCTSTLASLALSSAICTHTQFTYPTHPHHKQTNHTTPHHTTPHHTNKCKNKPTEMLHPS